MVPLRALGDGNTEVEFRRYDASRIRSLTSSDAGGYASV
jgi:hypothetical protein